MAKSPNHQVSRVIKPFAVTFYRANGRLPKTSEVMDAFHGQLKPQNYDAVRKALKRLEVAGPAKFAPPMKGIPDTFAPPRKKKYSGPKTLKGRLTDVRGMLETLSTQAEDGVVDAHSYDKLARLERQLMIWEKADAAESVRSGVTEVAPPQLADILNRYRNRKKQGLNAGGTRGEAKS